MEGDPQQDGPCVEYKPASEATGEAVYITTDQVAEYIEAGWTVDPFLGHHGKAGYWAATREV